MKVLFVYYPETGNTNEVAKAIDEVLDLNPLEASRLCRDSTDSRRVGVTTTMFGYHIFKRGKSSITTMLSCMKEDVWIL
ncbi:MAG: hypothetical protein ACKD6O_02355 [Candidatus Bathyarchaeota archaeon]